MTKPAWFLSALITVCFSYGADEIEGYGKVNAENYTVFTEQSEKFDARFKDVYSKPTKLAKPFSATLLRNGKKTELTASQVDSALASANPGDQFTLGAGTFHINTELASPLTITGTSLDTVLIFGRVKVKSLTLSTLTVLDSLILVDSAHRVWLENVRLLRSFGNQTPSETFIPRASGVIAVLGGFDRRAYFAPPSSNRYDHIEAELKHKGFDAYLGYALGSVSLESEELPWLAKFSGMKPFLKQYVNYLKGGEKPSEEAATEMLVAVRKLIDTNSLPPDEAYYPETKDKKIALQKAQWNRLAQLLKRDFGAKSGAPVLSPEAQQALHASADKAIRENRPLTALYFLSKLSATDLTDAESVAVAGKQKAARAKLGKLFGTAIDFQISVLDSLTADFSGYPNPSDYKVAAEAQRTTAIRANTTDRFPINQIADPATARYRVNILQTQDSWTNKISTSTVEERSYQIEDPALRAAEQAAASSALWAKFESTISNANKTASAIEQTAKTAYEQRVRIEDEGAGKALVTYEGKKNQGALKLDNPPLRYSPAPAGMITVTDSTKSLLYNNIRTVGFKGTITEAGKVADSIGPFSKTKSWNVSCKTTKTPVAGGGFRENSDCFKGTGGFSGGGKGGPVEVACINEILTPWVLNHFESRVFGENLKRLKTAGAKGNLADMAEMILLGRSLGIATSAEQDKILKEVFDDTQVFELIVASTSSQ